MNIYQTETKLCMKRLFALLDRNPLSPTYGCFHRCYWLHKLSDFPSASRQQGVLALAQYWKYDSSLGPRKKEVLELIEASILYTCSIQNKDGSFDEWYPNERGWAGPTGYVIHSLASTYEICQSELSEVVRTELLLTLKRGALFLSEGWEKHVLFNHIAMALLPIYQVFKITDDNLLEDHFKNLFVRFKKYFYYDEGWGLEYDGADIGYQSATISFLSRLHERMLEGVLRDEVRNICISSLSFIENFCFPDGRFSGKVGSRETDVLFHYGVEYWANSGNQCAVAISNFSRKGLVDGIILTPKDHEDHYFLYRLPEFLESANIFKIHEECTYKLPFERVFFEKRFQKAGILCLKKDHLYSVVNFQRGGVLLRYDCLQKVATHIDRGILLNREDGVFSSSQVSKNDVTELGEYKFIIRGKFIKFSPKAFSLLTFFLFRLSCLILAWNKVGAYWFKAFIRLLLLKMGSTSEHIFVRQIDLLSDEIVTDTSPSFNSDGHFSGEFDIRYVPQSRYFHMDDLKFSPKSKNS